ncbi:MAG: hydantoinase/oxoprolinase family protein, partial [Chloroflexi bacterium]
DFHDAHRQTYGYARPDAAVEVVNLRLRAVGQTPRPALQKTHPQADTPPPAPFDRRPVVLRQGIQETPFYHGAGLRPGHRVPGPAVIVHPDTTVFLDTPDRLTVDAYHNLVIEVGADGIS